MTGQTRGTGPSDPSDEDFARVAAHALDTTPYPALVLEVPSELIVAASSEASLLLDPSGARVVGYPLEHFTADRATAGPDLFAGGRLNGFEAFRVLRRAGGNLRVRMWIRSFADQPSSKYVLVVIVADDVVHHRSRPVDPKDSPAVVGTADASLIIERISSDADSLFGWSVSDLVGRSLIGVIAEHDAPTASPRSPRPRPARTGSLSTSKCAAGTRTARRSAARF